MALTTLPTPEPKAIALKDTKLSKVMESNMYFNIFIL